MIASSASTTRLTITQTKGRLYFVRRLRTLARFWPATPFSRRSSGSYPQPDWLIDRERLGDRLPPRVRARELWRISEPLLEQAQDDATRLAVSDMERAGVDVDHRRRDATGELLQPLRDRALRRRPGRARRRPRPHRSREPGAEGGRPDPPHVAGRGPRRRVPALDHRSPDQDHRSGAVHDDAAGPERPLRRRSGAWRSRTPTPSTRSYAT